MSTPAPHTPVIFLLKGGGSFFSVECQKLLIACALNPEWFGSYRHSLELKRQAEDRVNGWGAMSDEERQAKPQLEPTAQDRYLAGSTPAHLVQDGVYRDARGPDGAPGRNNPCASVNRATGYQHNNAPSVNLSAAAEHDVREVETMQRHDELARNNPGYEPVEGQVPPPGVLRNDTYRDPQRTADESVRSAVITDGQRKHWNQAMAEAGQPQSVIPPGSGAGGRADVASPGEMDAAAGPTSARVQQPAYIEGGAVEGTTAEECIDSFRERAKEAMASHGVDQAIKDAKKARREEVQRRYERRDARAREEAATAERDRVLNDPKSTAEQRRMARAEADIAITRRLRADAALTESRNATRDLRCLEESKKRLQTGENVADHGRAFP